jgi:hypothetical protein
MKMQAMRITAMNAKTRLITITPFDLRSCEILRNFVGNGKLQRIAHPIDEFI